MPVHATSVTGDIWQMEDHRLGVGEATDSGCVTNLMRGDCAQLIFTDPPYNVDYEGYTQKRMSIANDKMPREEFCAFLEAAFCSYRPAIKPTASFYVCHASTWQREFQNAIESARDLPSDRNSSGQSKHWLLGCGRYKFQHEPIFYGHVAGEKDPWFGSCSQSTI